MRALVTWYVEVTTTTRFQGAPDHQQVHVPGCRHRGDVKLERGVVHVGDPDERPPVVTAPDLEQAPELERLQGFPDGRAADAHTPAQLALVG